MQTLSEYLVTSGMTLTALANSVGVSKGYMSEIVNGSRTPSLPVALEIQRCTGGSVGLGTLVASSKRGSGTVRDQEVTE